MRTTSTNPLAWAVALAAIAHLTTGCTPKNAGPDPDVATYATAESDCERSLQDLAELIAAVAADASRPFPPGAVEEARELRAAAARLYIDGRCDLALELIDEAFALLRGGP